jgi:hypothetical protein
MAITKESEWLGTGSTEATKFHTGKGDVRPDEPDEDEKQDPRTEAEIKIARYCQQLLSSGIQGRQCYETFDLAWELYIGDMWPRGLARWKAKITVNKIRALIHFMQAVMVDNKPRYSVHPRVPGTEDAAKILGQLVDRDWDENDLQSKLALVTLWGLIWGTGIMKVGYDPRGAGGRGEHTCSPVVPYRVYVDPLATGIEDARFFIHIEPKALGWIYENYPEKALAVKKMRGSRVLSDEQRDFIREGQQSYFGDHGQNNQQLVGPGIVTPINVTNARDPSQPHGRNDDQDQIEVGEFWFRDERTEHYMRPKRVDGQIQTEDDLGDDGLPQLEIDRTITLPNPVDGSPMPYVVYKAKQKPIMEEGVRAKYPNGRLVVMAGPVVLVDIPNPYQIDGFPFAIWKNQDVGVFWGQGEPLALKDLNIGINRLLGQIYDNLNLTGNPSFLVNKNAGIDMRTLRSRPGLVIPTEMEVDKAMKPLDVRTLPSQFFELGKALSDAFNEVSGIADSVRAGNVPGNTAFATVDSLQESSSATLRQKVRNLEKLIKRYGKLRTQLIQQWDNGERPLRKFDDMDGASPWTPIFEDGNPEGRVVGVVPPASSTAVRFQNYTWQDLQGQVEFEIVPDSSLSTSPSSMWNKYMELWKNKLIDPVSFHEKFQLDDWRLIVKRMQAMQASQAASAKGPAKGSGSKKKPQAPAPPTNGVSRFQAAAVR